MATEKQIEANRKNAKLSTGPITPEGKEAVRFNALKHGMRADSFAVIRGENPAEFAERLSGWNISYDPTGPVEANLVRRAVVLSWRIDRATRFENAVLNRRVRDAVMACDCDDNDVDALTEAAGLAFFDASPEGEKFRRYQFALNRDMHRIMADLAKLQRRPLRQQMDKMMVVNGSIFDAVRQQFQSADDADEALRLAGIKIVDPDAWRKSFEPDETVDREPVPVSAPNKANSGEATAVDKGDRHTEYREPVPVSAPNKANLGEATAADKGDRHTEYREPVPVSAPNKANSGEATAADKEDRHTEYREPVPVSAPNEANPEARRGSPDPAEAVDREPVLVSAPNKANFPAPVDLDFEQILNETRSHQAPRKGKGSSWVDISCSKS